MAQQKGSNVKVLLGFESTFGQAPSAGYSLYINSSGLRETQAVNAPATLTGSRNPAVPFRGNRDVRGTIVVPIDSTCMAYWLKAMFGDPTTTGTDPYTHEYKIGDTMPSFTFETGFEDLATNEYQRFLGCKVSGFSLTVGGDGELTGNIDVVGASGSLESSSFDASPTSVSLNRVNNFQAAIEEGGATLSNATELTINVNFGLDDSVYVIGGSGTRGSLPEGTVEVSGNLKALFEDVSLLNKALNGTESSLKLTITASASSIFELEIQELQYERNSVDVPGPQGLLVDLNFRGYYDDGSEASAIVARVTNSLSSL